MPKLSLPSALLIALVSCAESASGEPETGTDSTGVEADSGSSDAFFSASERSTILAWLGTLPETAPDDPTNRVADDPAAAQLGQALFFDARTSGDGTVSCATCHDPAAAFDDPRSNTSQGAGLTPRASLSILNGAYGAAGEDVQIWQFWDGRRDSQWSQALGPIEDPNEMAGSRSATALLIYDEYRDQYEAVFGAMPPLRDGAGTPLVPAGTLPGDGVWETLPEADQTAVTEVFVNYGKAVEAFERRLVSRNSRFDQFWAELSAGADDSDALSDLEKEGLRVFIDKGRCLGCHSGPNFTDGQFHNIAVPQVGDNIPANDLGRAGGIDSLITTEFSCAGPWSDRPDKSACQVSQLSAGQGEVGAFKTPTLRNVSVTAPFMHTGMFSSLDQVVSHYDLGGGPPGSFDGSRDELMRPLGLDLGDRQALVAFLMTLEGEPVDAALTKAP